MGESVALNPIRYLSVTTMEKRIQNLKEKLKMYQSVARWERSQTLNPIINLLKKTWKRGYDLESDYESVNRYIVSLRDEIYLLTDL